MTLAFDAAAFHAARRGAWGGDLALHASLGSTQDAALTRAQAGAGQGSVVLAESQSAGRGRWGKAWEGRPGLSLLFTVLLGPWGSATAGTLPLALGLASVQALRGLGLAAAQCKWPNDLWWHDRKLGGLLLERRGDWLLAGCGLNVGQGPDDWPPGLLPGAVSLVMAGLAAPRETVLAALLEAWERMLERWRVGGLASLSDEWAQVDALAGRDCRLRQGERVFQARVLGLAQDGALRVRLPDGSEADLASAEVEQVRPLGPDRRS